MPARLNIRVTREFLDRLEKYCAHHGVDKTAVVRIAITEYLDQHPLPTQIPADEFANKFAKSLGFEDYDLLMDSSVRIHTEGDTNWFVSRLPGDDWAAWNDAELALDRVSYHDTWEEAEAAQHTTCAYCGANIPVFVARDVPGIDDDDAWQKEAKYHLPSCEWVRTRAHRI